MQPRHGLGIMLMLLTNLIIAGKQVFLGHTLQKLDTVTVVFLCFAIATIVFHAMQRRSACHHPIKPQWKNALWLNVFTVGSWLGFFFAMKFIEPAIAATIITAIGPILTVGINPLLRRHVPVLKVEAMAAFGIFLAVLYLGFVMYSGRSALANASSTTIFYGSLAAFINGVSIIGNLFFAKRLCEARWNTMEILGRRFFLLLIITGIMTLSKGTLFSLSWIDWGSVAAISLIGVIVPLVLKQMAIHWTEPIVISITMTATPLFTLILQRLDNRLVFSAHSLFGTAIIFCLLIVSLAARQRHARRHLSAAA